MALRFHCDPHALPVVAHLTHVIMQEGDGRSRRAVTRHLLMALDGLRDSHAAPLLVLSVLQLWPEAVGVGAVPGSADAAAEPSPHAWAQHVCQAAQAASAEGPGGCPRASNAHLVTVLEVLDAMRPYEPKNFEDLWPSLLAGGFLRLLPRAFPVTLLPLRMCAPMAHSTAGTGTALARVVVHSLALKTIGGPGAGSGTPADSLAREMKDLAVLRGHLYFEALFALGTAVKEADRYDLANVLLFPMMQWQWVDGVSRVRWLVAAAASSPSTFAFCRAAIRVFVEALFSAVATDLSTPVVAEEELARPGSPVTPSNFVDYWQHMWEAVVWALGTCSRWLDALHLLDPKDTGAFCRDTLQPMVVEAVGWAPTMPPQHVTMALVHFQWPADTGVGPLWHLNLTRALAFCLDGRPKALMDTP
jgi:hypothetical protein